MDIVLFGAGCIILGAVIGASVGLLVLALCYAAKRGDRHDEE
nr:MAG TPA: Protein of unknown function (DUF3789) [Caudoviricetes sp.]